MTFIARLRERSLRPEINRRASFYASEWTQEARSNWQLKRFNRVWGRVSITVPYFQRLRREGNIPPVFRHWTEVADHLPVTSRQLVQDNLTRMTSQESPPQWYRTTGGSTAQPIQLPAWYSERRHLRPNVWLGRSGLGIAPSDRAFWIWGHSHLLGSGVRGWVNGRKREFYDHLLGYSRYSAYNLGEGAMRRAGRALIEHRPQYIIGYSCALDAFVRSNQDRTEDFRKLDLKTVIACAEAFPRAESAALISETLSAPVSMEYGSVETGLLGYLVPGDTYRIFWQSYFVEAVDQGPGRRHGLLVTSLYPRSFPLVRYDHGDDIELAGPERSSLDRIGRVIGRCNDYIELSDGAPIHSEAFTHVVRDTPEIQQYQVVQKGSTIRLLIVSENPIPEELASTLRFRLHRIHSELATIAIESVRECRQTVAGKTPMVIREMES